MKKKTKILKNIDYYTGKSDDMVIKFFEEIRPPKKGEAYTFLIPLMVELKLNLEEAIKNSIK